HRHLDSCSKPDDTPGSGGRANHRRVTRRWRSDAGRELLVELPDPLLQLVDALAGLDRGAVAPPPRPGAPLLRARDGLAQPVGVLALARQALAQVGDELVLLGELDLDLLLLLLVELAVLEELEDLRVVGGAAHVFLLLE